LPDIFRTAAERTVRDEQLLGGSVREVLPPLGVTPVSEDDRIATEIGSAASNVDPTTLSRGTRAGFLKRLVLRVLNVFTYGQVAFNRAVLGILTAWDHRFRLQVDAIARKLDARVLDGIALLDERRALWESRLRSDVSALEDRLSLSETDAVIAHNASEEQGRTLSRLEASVVDLRAELESARNRAAALDFSVAKITDRVETIGRGAHRGASSVFHGSGYLEFEHQNRGPRSEILDRQKFYLPLLQRVRDEVPAPARFVDLGCGRGELLELARGAGLVMSGFDSDAAMVSHCRAQGLVASEADLFEALDTFPDGSLAGVTALQVIEHLEYEDIVRLVSQARRKLASRGCLIFETINPLSVYAMRHFYLDPTHRHPVPATTAAFLLKAEGLVDVETFFLTPVHDVPAQEKLASDPRLAPLEEFLFGYQDYAVFGRRP
jgi:SAM-dependent methyltransferase